MNGGGGGGDVSTTTVAVHISFKNCIPSRGNSCNEWSYCWEPFKINVYQIGGELLNAVVQCYHFYLIKLFIDLYEGDLIA